MYMSQWEDVGMTETFTDLLDSERVDSADNSNDEEYFWIDHLSGERAG